MTPSTLPAGTPCMQLMLKNILQIPPPFREGGNLAPPLSPFSPWSLLLLLQPNANPPLTKQLDLLKVVKEAISSVLARLKALEKQTMPPPLPPIIPPHLALAEASVTAAHRTQSRPPAHRTAPAAADPTTPCPTPPAGEGWSLGIQGAIHLVPGSFTYAMAA